LDVFARRASRIHVAFVERVGEFGGEHPALALRGDRAAHYALRFSLAVDVRGVDRIDALLQRLVDDAGGGRFVGRAAEHHRAERERGNLDAAAAELSIFHVSTVPSE